MQLLWLQHALAIGVVGLLLENLFTGLKSYIKHRDVHFVTYSHLSVIPVYSTAGMALECLKVNMHCGWFLTSILYVLVIYSSEFIWAFIYKRFTDRNPWEYKGSGSILGMINWHYFPLWFLVSLESPETKTQV